jgi:hypothetical protein
LTRRDPPHDEGPDAISTEATVASGDTGDKPESAKPERIYPREGVRICDYCGNRPDHLERSSTGKLLPHEASGIVHMAVCPGRRRNKRGGK